MKKQNVLKAFAVLLVFGLCVSMLPASAFAVPEVETSSNKTATLEDFLAGNATAKDIYGILDESIVPEIIGYEEAVAKNHVARLYDDEGTDLNKIVFLNVDGSKTMYTFDFPVKYIDEQGNIKDIRLEIADSTANAGEFETAANTALTTFSARFSDGISLEGNDTEIRLVPILPSLNSGAATMSASSIAANVANEATAQRIDENTIEYRYDAKTTVEYSLTYTGFKEDIVVSEYTGQTTYPFRLYTNGLALAEIDGAFYLVDDDGNIDATIGDIIIFTADERNNAFGDIVPTTIVENEEYLLNIVIDAEYLADPNTVYPIRIDPTIEINYNDSGASAIEDITISTNTNFAGSYTSLYVGRRETEGIARILMRFPGLDISDFHGATVTSAAVLMRDLMCEGAALDVSCHVFTGNVWDANSATWSNVSPNNYVSAPLSTNTLSWSTGNAFTNQHWYPFDITAAVQGWIDGNYTQGKGIIFKVASTIENGSTISNRTFGSYNRASYKPSLSVTYTSNQSQIIQNGTRYLNNRGTGKYVQLTTSGTAAGVSGLLSSIGSTVQWEMQKVSSGYVIRSASDPTKYLAGSTSATSSAVSILTIDEAELPTRCVWLLSSATAGGYLVKNVYSNRYLYSSGTSLYTTSSTGAYGTSTYETCVWRIPSTSTYGNTSSYSSRELTAGFSISDLIVNIGETKNLSISKTPSNALWANAEDFTFTRSSGTIDCISTNIPRNSFTGTKIGIATYTAKHKVTNRTVTFKVYVDRFTYELTNEFGFDDSDALLIRDVYNRIDSAYPNESILLRAWRASRALGGVVYDHQRLDKTALWLLVAGNVCTGREDAYFTSTLNFTQAQYAQIKSAIGENYENTNNADFAHMQMALAGRLAYQTGENGVVAEYDETYGEEELSYLCGWLGDAVIAEGGSTSIGNDDYHADLDAENIYRLMLEGCTLVDATNTYYASLTASSTRATKFLSYINYETIKAKIYEWLIDQDLQAMMIAASEQGNMTAYWYYYDLLSDEQYHIDAIRNYNPDTYDFMCSIRDGRADIADYE